MRILIIGNTSMVGKSLYRRFAPIFYVKTAGRSNSADFKLNLASIDEDITILDEFDVIIHCAASFADNQINNAIQNELINSLGALKVGKVAQLVRCKHLIYISTISVYNFPENGYYGSYGISKLHGQENLEFICKQLGIGFTSLQPSQIYDITGEARKHQGLFYHIIDCAKENRAIELFGTKNPKRNYLYIEDLVDIIERVVKQQVFGVFPCICSQSYTLSEIAGIAFEVFGNKAKVNFLPGKPDISSSYIPDNFDLYQLINYNPNTDLPRGISLIRDYYSILNER